MLVTKDILSDVLERLSQNEVMSLDTETYGLKPFHGDRLFSIIIADKDDEFYFDFMHTLEPELMAVVMNEIDWYEKLWFMHNAIFDMTMLYMSCGHRIEGIVHDTMAIERLVYNDRYQNEFDLATVAARYGYKKDDTVERYIDDNKLWEWESIPGKQQRKKNKHYDQVPFDLIVPYGERDARITYDIGMKQIAKISDMHKLALDYNPKAPDIHNVLHNERRLTETCFKMKLRGVKIDEDYCKDALQHWELALDQAKEDFKRLTGHDFKDSGKVFSAIMGEDSVPKTEKGNPSFKSENLEPMESPVAKSILSCRKAKSYIDYFLGFLYHADEHNVIHAELNQSGTRTGRFSSSNPNCLSLDTEILTENGWRGAFDLLPHEKVFCFDVKNASVSLQEIETKYMSPIQEHKWVHVKNTHTDMLLTDNHRCLFQDRKTGEYKVRVASKFPKDAKILHGYLWNNYSDRKLHWWEIALLVATQADAHFTLGKQISFTFSKDRKHKRLKKSLEQGCVTYTYRYNPKRKTHRYTIHKDSFMLWDYLDADKKFKWSLLHLDAYSRSLFLKELRFWDGLSTRRPLTYCSLHKVNVDIIQSLCAVSGRRCHISKYKGKYYNIYVTNRNYSLTSNVKLKKETKLSMAWCVKVPTGFFFARRGNDTFITGNCQNLTKEDQTSEFAVRRAIVPRKDYYLFMMDYDQQEYRLFLDYTGDRVMCEKVNGGLDVHTATAEIAGIERSHAKTVNFGILYGIGDDGLARNLGCDLTKASSVKASVFSANPAIAVVIRNIKNSAAKRGFTWNWYGRHYQYPDKRFVRKAPNAVIQGGGADCIKLAMNRCDDLLREMRSALVLCIHDELVFEIHKSELHIIGKLKEILETAYPHRYVKLTTGVQFSDKSLLDSQDYDLSINHGIENPEIHSTESNTL